MTGGDEGANGRVTLALLQQDNTLIKEKLNRIESLLVQYNHDCGTLKTSMAVADTELDILQRHVKDLDAEVTILQKTNSVWNALNSIAAIIAGALGGIGLGGK